MSNLDIRTTAAQREKRDQSERNQFLIGERYSRAAKAEKHQGIEAPDIVFEGFQEQGLYSYDPKFDNSREAVAGRTHLPVKEKVIRTDGTMVKTLGPAALECVMQGLFCMRCEQRQPDNLVQKREGFRRMKDMGVHIVGTVSDQCCYCGGLLGIQGEAEQVGSEITPEQKAMIQ